MPLIDIKELKGCCIIRPHGSAEIALTQKFSERLNHFEIPTVEAEPVRHSRWVCVNEEENVWWCDGCGGEIQFHEHTPESAGLAFCPYCGAKMDGGETDAGK